VQIVLNTPSEGPPTFEAKLKLKDYKLPEDALVFVEAYRQTQWMRFPFGKVGSLLPPPDRRLTAFDSPDGILFRVRVTSSTGHQGVMLAEADKVPVRKAEDEDDNRLPILPVRPAELGSQVWRLDFSDAPVLLINKASGDWRAVTNSPVFRSLACPSALREILTRILFLEDYPDLEDREDWKTRWLLFAAGIPGSAELPPEDDKDRFEDWIETAVEAFAARQHFFDQFLTFWQAEGN
jgi:hypothetical protein